MAEHGSRQRGDIFVRDVISMMRKSASFCRQNDKLRGAHAGAVIDIFLDEIRRGTAVVARGATQLDHIIRERLTDRDHAHEFLEIENLFR
ncbi:MAG: hypothetical protein JWN92_2283 [Candidatus Acidoferrum typicum]|nr:hypothetical protein [Candidatus Acidoferrum typicum]